MATADLRFITDHYNQPHSGQDDSDFCEDGDINDLDYNPYDTEDLCGEVMPSRPVASNSSLILVARPRVKRHRSKNGCSEPMSNLVITAIKPSDDTERASLRAIKKYLEATYKVDSVQLAPYLESYLRTGVCTGQLMQKNGKGRMEHFRIGKLLPNPKQKRRSKKTFKRKTARCKDKKMKVCSRKKSKSRSRSLSSCMSASSRSRSNSRSKSNYRKRPYCENRRQRGRQPCKPIKKPVRKCSSNMSNNASSTYLSSDSDSDPSWSQYGSASSSMSDLSISCLVGPYARSLSSGSQSSVSSVSLASMFGSKPSSISACSSKTSMSNCSVVTSPSVTFKSDQIKKSLKGAKSTKNKIINKAPQKRTGKIINSKHPVRRSNSASSYNSVKKHGACKAYGKEMRPSKATSTVQHNLRKRPNASKSHSGSKTGRNGQTTKREKASSPEYTGPVTRSTGKPTLDATCNDTNKLTTPKHELRNAGSSKQYSKRTTNKSQAVPTSNMKHHRVNKYPYRR